MKDIEKSIERSVRSCDWIYRNAGDSWSDGMFTGNGTLGIVASAPFGLEYLINSAEVFDALTGSPFRLTHQDVMRIIREENRRESSFIGKYECGERAFDTTVTPAALQIHFGPVGWAAPSVPRISQHLNLYEGILRTDFRSHRRNGSIESFTPRNTRLFCLHMNLNEPFATHFHTLYLFRPDCCRFSLPEWRETEEGSVLFEQKMFEGDDASFFCAMKIVSKTGQKLNFYGDGTYRKLTLSGEFELYLSIHSSRFSDHPAEDALFEVRNAVASGWDSLAEKHRAWWKEYWNRCYVFFSGERKLQRYFTFSLYESASVYGKSPMPGLNGLAYGPLNSFLYGVNTQGYTHDQNQQIPFLPFAPLNRMEFTESMADTYLAAAPRLRSHTRELFGCGGIFLPLCMNQSGGDLLQGGYRYTLCGSAYTGAVLAKAWRFSHDERVYKEKFYPLLKAFTEFYLGIMSFSGADGKYHLDWSVPPEIFTLTRDDTATLALLKTIIDVLLEAGAEYGMDDPFLDICRNLAAHYPDFAIHSAGGWWCGPDVPEDHAMYGGHLFYPFFPAESMEDTQKAEKTVEYFDQFAIERACEGHDGMLIPCYDWSWFNYFIVRQRLHPSMATWEELKDHIRLYGKENGFFTHCPVIPADPDVTENYIGKIRRVERVGRDGKSCFFNFAGGHSTLNPRAKRKAPPVPEGNAIFLFAAAEAMLQSWGGIIRLFPGVPADFSGKFYRMLTRGAFEVSAEMKKGKVTSCTIRALANGRFRLLDPGGGGRIITKELQKEELFEFCPQ